MLRADLENENNTIRAYRERVRQCESIGVRSYAIAEDIREILRQEQEHRISPWRSAKTLRMSRAAKKK